MKVLRRNNKRCDRKGGKQKMPWTGPYHVIKINEQGTAKIANMAGITLKTTYNASQLKPYVHGEELPASNARTWSNSLPYKAGKQIL